MYAEKVRMSNKVEANEGEYVIHAHLQMRCIVYCS